LEVTDVNNNVYRTSKNIEVTKAEFPAAVVWNYSYETPVLRLNEGSNAPVIGEDGTIFYVEGNAAEESKVVAVTDAGENAEFKWATAIGHQISNAPSIGPDGNIYINSWLAASSTVKMDANNGEILWNSSIGTGVSNNTAAVDSQGNIYHGSRAQGTNGGAFSFTSEGEMRWSITEVGAFYAAPALSSDEATIYFLNTNENKIWAVNTEDGSLKWEESVGAGSGSTGSSLSIDADGTVYYTSNTHVVAVIDNESTGVVKWATEVSGAANSGVVIGPEGNLYTGATSGVHALDPSDGSIKWSYNAEITESVPAVDINGNVYVGTANGSLLILGAEGELEKELELGDNVANSPTIANDGTVYIEVYDEGLIRLFKVAVENSAPANSAWPMKGQNTKNTAKAIN
jgi:outer membrane protein assembly factor BamB